MDKKIKLALVVSDLHCGSTCGLLPPDFETFEGNKVSQSPIQKWLWSCWVDATQKWLPSVVGSDPYALIVNGDAIEGNHHGTKEVISPDANDHAQAALIALQPLRDKAAKTFIVEGTEIHTNNTESTLGKLLGSVKDTSNGRHSWKRLDVTIHGTRCIFQHHVSTATRVWSEATGLSSALANEQLEAARNGEEIPRVLGSAHRHRFGCYESDNAVSFVTHAWQGLTRHGMKVVPSARINPGMVLLDWRRVTPGSAPEVQIRSYRLPQALGVSL